MMEKAELYDILNSEFWRDVKGRMNEEREDTINDLVKMDYTKPESLQLAIKYQTRIDTYNDIDTLIEDMKEEAMQEVK